MPYSDSLLASLEESSLGSSDRLNVPFIKAFKDVMKIRAEENAKAVFGDTPNESNNQAIANIASTVNPAFDASKVEHARSNSTRTTLPSSGSSS